MSDLNKGFEKFVNNTLSQYHDAIQIDKWVENISVNELDIDNSFTQIAIRPQIEDDVFRLDNDIYPGIFGLERPIILGEIRFFVKELLKRKTEDNSLYINKEELTPGTLANYIEDWDASILAENKILYGEWLKNPTWLKEINIFTKSLKFQDESPLFSITAKLIPEIKNIIIIYNHLYTKWKYGIFKNEFTGKKERLYIKIGDIENGRRDVIIKTVNKVEAISPKIKFIEWED